MEVTFVVLLISFALMVIYFTGETERLDTNLRYWKYRNKKLQEKTAKANAKIYNGVYVNKNTGELVVFKDLEYVGEL